MEGLQIQRHEPDKFGPGIHINGQGDYVLFSDAEKFHAIAQEALGKNMKLTAELVSSRANHVDANKRNMKAQTEVDALTAEREKLLDHMREIGNRVGRPTLDYAPEIADEQMRETIQVVSVIAQAALKDKP